MSTAVTVFNIEAWYAALKFGARVEFSGTQLHFTRLCELATEHQKSVFADELGVGAALLASQYVLRMQYFADLEWFLTGKPVQPIDIFSTFSGALVSGLAAPDFIILDEGGYARLLESKGTFDKNFSGQLTAGKAQINNVTLTGPKVLNGVVAASKFPSTNGQRHRPLTVFYDPDSGGAKVPVDPQLIKICFYSKILAFFGFQADALRLLSRRPLEDIAPALRGALSLEGDALPLFGVGAEEYFVISRLKAEELYFLSFGERWAGEAPVDEIQRPRRRRTRRTLSDDLMPIGIGFSDSVWSDDFTT